MGRLTVRGLGKSFNSAAETLRVLEGVDLEMAAGENASIVGPSGCGKSTLLYILGTLDTPTDGEFFLGDINPFELQARDLARFRNEEIGFIFQDHHLLPQLSVLENVLLPAMAAKSPGADDRARAEKLIDDVGLSERIQHLPGQLSGGERQRVAVARALLKKPKLLLADEPTGNLDEENTKRISSTLFDLPQQEGAMLIVVTHSAWLAGQAQKQLRLEHRKLVGASEAVH